MRQKRVRFRRGRPDPLYGLIRALRDHAVSAGQDCPVTPDPEPRADVGVDRTERLREELRLGTFALRPLETEALNLNGTADAYPLQRRKPGSRSPRRKPKKA